MRIGMKGFKLETHSKLVSKVCIKCASWSVAGLVQVENCTSHSRVLVMQCTCVQTDLHDLSCHEGYECMMHSISQFSLSMTEV
jgi:hypothetical protein